MKRKKFTKFLTVFLVVVLAMSLLLLSACNNTNEPSNLPNIDDKDKVDLPIKNGNFEYTDGNEYPKSADEWSGSNQTDNENINAGVINIGKDYERNKNKWGGIKNPNKPKDAKDDNILMIHSNEPASYYFNSSSISIKQHKKYKISVFVKTTNLEGKTITDNDDKSTTLDTFGARVYVSSNAYADFIDIKTEGKWKKVEIYIEGSDYKDSTVTLRLGLGEGSSSSKHLTKGYAFFDQAKIEEIDKATFDNAPYNKTTKNGYIAKDTMRLPNTEFVNFNKNNSLPAYPYSWESRKGGDTENPAPIVSIHRGIIDLSESAYNSNKSRYGNMTEYPGLRENATDNNVLMIAMDKPSAYGYVSKNKIYIEKGKIYKLSLWVKLMQSEDKNGSKRPIKSTLKLVGGPNEEVLSLTNESMNDDNNGWTQVEFNIRGNQYHDVSYKMQLWLGTGGENEPENHSCGWALFDGLRINELNSWNNNNSDTIKNIDLYSNSNLIQNGSFANVEDGDNLPIANNWIESKDNIKPNTVVNGVIDTANTDEAYWKNLGIENPNMPYNFSENNKIVNSVYMINNKILNAFKLASKNEVEIYANHYYRIAVWVKTSGIRDDSGLNIYITKQKEDSTERENLASVKNINTNKLDKDELKLNNGWQEVVFYIEGDTLKVKDLKLEFQLGSGQKFDTSTLAKGYGFICNANMTAVSSDDYSNARSNDNTKKYSFIDVKSIPISNGNFDILDNDKTDFDEDGTLKDTPGVPKYWTASKKTQENVKHGIINTENKNADFVTMLNNAGITPEVISNMSNFKFNGLPNALMINSSADTTFNYKSKRINFSAGKYYRIAISVYTLKGANAQVTLTSESPSQKVEDTLAFSEVQTNDNWKTYVYYIKTGLNSASAYLNLSLGDKDVKFDAEDNTGKSKGTVLFDNAQLLEIGKDQYNAVKQTAIDKYELTGYNIQDLKHLTFSTDGFETNSNDENLVNPNNWTSKDVTNAKKENTNAGIFNTKKTLNIDEDTELANQIREYLKLKSKTNLNLGTTTLVINNKEKNGFTFESKKPYSFDKNKYYKVSILVLTKDIEAKKGIDIVLHLKDDANMKFNAINNSEWTEYSFYIKTAEKEKLDNVKFEVNFGKYLKENGVETADFIKGTALFDNFYADAITEKEFNNAKANETTKTLTLKDDQEIPDDKDKEEEPKPEMDWTFLSWAIPTIILGLVVIIVLIIFFYKKYALPKKNKKFKKNGKKNTKFKSKNVKKKDNFDKFED